MPEAASGTGCGGGHLHERDHFRGATVEELERRGFPGAAIGAENHLVPVTVQNGVSFISCRIQRRTDVAGHTMQLRIPPCAKDIKTAFTAFASGGEVNVITQSRDRRHGVARGRVQMTQALRFLKGPRLLRRRSLYLGQQPAGGIRWHCLTRRNFSRHFRIWWRWLRQFLSLDPSQE